MNKKFHLSAFQIIVIGFMILILIGTLFLMLPISTQGSGHACAGDALFTAVSACCVTGLVVQNTATYWTGFGQFIIIVLIQIGGMGVVTFAMMFAIMSGKRIGLMERTTLQTMIDAPQIGGILTMTKFVLKVTGGIEALGAVMMFPVFYLRYGVLKGLWYSVFHSVSAFCNAGFDLLGEKTAYCSLMEYKADAWINLVIMFLIVSGGIGFFTMHDIRKHKFNFRRYSLQSKVIICVSLLLIILPAVYLYFFEFCDGKWGMLDNSEKILASLFQSVTTRTAGFNTVDLGAMREASIMVLIILMLIGGSPGSTAGGFKTTTLATLLAGCVAVFRQKSEINLYNRRIDDDTLRCASTIFSSYLILFIMGSMVISVSESVPMMTAMFEAASAIGTVGLTLGITPGLGLIARGVLIILMFFGRAGALTLVFSAIPKNRNTFSKLPKEKIIVG